MNKPSLSAISPTSSPANSPLGRTTNFDLAGGGRSGEIWAIAAVRMGGATTLVRLPKGYQLCVEEALAGPAGGNADGSREDSDRPTDASSQNQPIKPTLAG